MPTAVDPGPTSRPPARAQTWRATACRRARTTPGFSGQPGVRGIRAGGGSRSPRPSSAVASWVWQVPIWPGQRNPSDPSNAVRDPTTPTRTGPGGSHDTPNPKGRIHSLHDLGRDALETCLPDLHEPQPGQPLLPSRVHRCGPRRRGGTCCGGRRPGGRGRHRRQPGGGIALAAAGLVPDLLGVMPGVPFMCHFRRPVDLSHREPYTEITTYLSVTATRSPPPSARCRTWTG